MDKQNNETNLYSRQKGLYGIETMKEIIDNAKNNMRRDDTSIKILSLLNPLVEIGVMKENDLKTHLVNNIIDKSSKYEVVIISGFISLEEIIKLNNLCRKNIVWFIYRVELVIFGFCFVDFGYNYCLTGESGKEPLSYCIKSISKEKKVLYQLIQQPGN